MDRKGGRPSLSQSYFLSCPASPSPLPWPQLTVSVFPVALCDARGGWQGGCCRLRGFWVQRGCFGRDQGFVFTSFSRWTSSNWTPGGGLPCTWPPPWGTSSVPVCSWHMVQMWAGRIAAAGQVGTPATPSPQPGFPQHHILTCPLPPPPPPPVLQEAVSTRDLELVQLVLRYRDYQRVVKRLAGIPVLLEKLRKVRQPLGLPAEALEPCLSLRLRHSPLTLQAQDFYVEMKWEFTSWGKRG